MIYYELFTRFFKEIIENSMWYWKTLTGYIDLTGAFSVVANLKIEFNTIPLFDEHNIIVLSGK